jgi:hypothetical protein
MFEFDHAYFVALIYNISQKIEIHENTLEQNKYFLYNTVCAISILFVCISILGLIYYILGWNIFEHVEQNSSEISHPIWNLKTQV